MQDVPILNNRLRVACIGMRVCDDGWLAALVTPWFINLMLLPADGEAADAWRRSEIGSKSLHQFPAGRFEFIVGELADIGRYRMCSLFSPVLEFEDQAAAELTAAAALEALFDAEHGGDIEGGARDAVPAEEAVSVAPAPVAAPSRRGLLFGMAAARGSQS
jgi:[NiFe] hydrogenase assembly HybE family chaperone